MRTALRAGGAVAMLVATTIAAAAVVATPAQAATPEIVVSTDGVNFAPATAVPLFDDLALIVPGDVMTGQLWVRNQSSTTALVRIAVSDLVVPSAAFGAAVTLTSTMNGFSYASSLASLSDCQVVVQAQSLMSGGTVRVDFDVNMSSATSGSDAQGETASLGFVVTGHDWAAGPFPDANGCSTVGSTGGTAPSLPNTSGPRLPFTGASEVVSSVFVALGLLALGSLFALWRRRRSEEVSR